jgi:uncharacterized protein (TIGR03086 family)
MSTTDPDTLLVRSMELFDAGVSAVPDDAWQARTPCTDWGVRELVNHVTVEDLWIPPLFAGATIEEVGDRFDGDQLGEDPKAAWADAFHQARAAVDDDGAMARTVHLSFGDLPGSEYALQLFADHLIHYWDLASATGQAAELPRDLVAACVDWFSANEEAYRSAGAIGPRPDVPPGGGDQATLLAMFGRPSTWTP